MKKRITTLLLALSMLLTFPSAVSADTDRQVGEAIRRDPHTTGGTVEWISNNLYGYDHFIQVCTIGYNDDADDRAADAVAEWTENGGELGLIYAGWSDSTCLANLER